MTKQEYENEIKELKERLEKLETAKIEKPQSKRWKPKHRDDYYTVNSAGHIDCDACYNARIDDWAYLTGNCFKSEEEAEEYKKQIECTARYKNYIEEHSEPLDWNNNAQPKYYAEFEHTNNKINVDWFYYEKFQGTIYASSEQIIKDAIKEIGEDNFKKYVLGVK